MAAAIERCTTEEQSSVVHIYIYIFFFFLWAEGLDANDIHKGFMFTVGSVCRLKLFTTGGRSFADDEVLEAEVQKWL
jgi:hypothetical protein